MSQNTKPINSGRGLWDAVRHTFPKHLRWNAQTRMFHGQLRYVVTRYRFKRYIPRKELVNVLNEYEVVPYSCLRWMGVRHLLLLRYYDLIVRQKFQSKNNWMLSKSMEVEHAIVVQWLKVNSNHQYVDREKFSREVMDDFSVAQPVHFFYLIMFLSFLMIVGWLVLFSQSERTMFLYASLYQRWSRKDIKKYYADLLALQSSTRISEAYKDKIPAPVVRSEKDGFNYLQVLEMRHKDTRKTILFVPMPMVGTTKTFDQIGQIARACDAVMLEMCTAERLRGIPMHAVFPGVKPYYPALGLTVRYWRLFESNKEPPKLFPGAKAVTTNYEHIHALLPGTILNLYSPVVGLDKDSARVGWARLKEALKDDAVSTICCPWNIVQITNLQASLLRQGWTYRLGPKVKWVDPDGAGDHFCDHFGWPKEEDEPLALSTVPKVVWDGFLDLAFGDAPEDPMMDLLNRPAPHI